ncbi:MAG: hypothetical protein KGH58_04670, partial [Candidatus Micrarchaeota archaeon]|nr:hypothetical protein [Candidatus Micrarchaeota archaeon]
KVPPKNLTVVVATNSLNFTNVNITVTVANVPTNVITPTINGNATKPVQIVNITVVPEGNAVVTTRMNLTYDCSLPASSVAPYILKNYTWREITNFTIDTSACSVSFAIPNDPVIAVFAAPQAQQSGSGGSGGIQASGGGPIVGYPQPSTQPTTSVTTTAPTTVPTTTPTTTAATTTVSEVTTTIAQQQGSGSSSKPGSGQPGGKTGSTIPLLGGLAIAGAHAGRLRKRLKRRY